MDPIVLVDKKDLNQKPLAYACGKCGVIYVQEELARMHCVPKICECGKPAEYPYILCRLCSENFDIARRTKNMAKAEIVHFNSYDGPVYWENKDEYFGDIGAAWDAICDDPTWNPEDRKSIWLQPRIRFYLILDGERMIEEALESQEHHEDAYVATEGRRALAEYLATWNEEHGREVESWIPDSTKKIPIPQSWWDAFDAGYAEPGE